MKMTLMNINDLICLKAFIFWAKLEIYKTILPYYYLVNCFIIFLLLIFLVYVQLPSILHKNAFIRIKLKTKLIKKNIVYIS
jgi:hypothetical protein